MKNWYWQFFRTPILALLSNKMRSFLTMLGIIIGVGAVIVIMAIGAGAQGLILAEIKSIGTDVVGVLPGYSGDDGPPASAMGIVVTTLTYDDVQDLKKKKNVPNVRSVVAYSTGAGSVGWGANTYDTSLSGSTASYMDVEGGEIKSGRFFTEEEEKDLSKVVVLGYTVKQELFGDSDAVGQRIKVKKKSFTVIGVMAERGTVAFQDYDDRVILPIKTMQKVILGVNHVSMIRMKIDNEKNASRAIEDVKLTLRDSHDIDLGKGDVDDFTVRGSADALDMITDITNSLKYFLAAMAAISLVVGGIGIMNIMLVSVTERTREIGLRKAVGANNENILMQFLLEAVTMTFIGGVIGVVGGVVLSYIIYLGAMALNYENWEFSVSILSVLLGVGISTLVGLIFGIAPAKRASKLEPVQALSYE